MQAQADRNELDAFSLDLLQGTGLATTDGHFDQSRDPFQPMPPEPPALSWGGMKAEPISSANSSIPLDILSAQQVISHTCDWTDWVPGDR